MAPTPIVPAVSEAPQVLVPIPQTPPVPVKVKKEKKPPAYNGEPAPKVSKNFKTQKLFYYKQRIIEQKQPNNEKFLRDLEKNQQMKDFALLKDTIPSKGSFIRFSSDNTFVRSIFPVNNRTAWILPLRKSGYDEAQGQHTS